jgi:hypothetical protein
MKIQILSLLTVLLAIQYSYGQVSRIENEKWTEKPLMHSLDNKYSKESAIMIADKRRVEFIDEAKGEIGEYYTLHKIIHINDDRGIEEFNKIYLGISENSDIVDVKARTILPGGKIIELDKNNIKDIKEEDGNVYKIFAMEGLEKGCEIEYFYTFKKAASFFGKEVLQESFPVLETQFQIIGPERLRFEIKPYNFSVSANDTITNKKRIIQINYGEIQGAEAEKYASYKANLKRIEFKLSYNDAINKGERLFTWNGLAKRIYEIYTYSTEKENNQVSDIVKENEWDKIGKEPLKIIAVENYVKKHFSYQEELKNEDANKLESVIKNKIGGIIGIMRLYNSIFKNLGINYQFVLTGDRSKFIIDRQFENWNNCDYPLFYFPAEGKFLTPTRPDYRYPWVLPDWGDTNGLFCKHTSLGNFSTAIAEIRPIKLEDYNNSFNNIESRIELNSNLDSANVDAKQSYGGYIAVNYRDAFNFSNEEEKRRLIKELAKMVSNSENLVSSEISNQEFENENNNLPLILHTKSKSGGLIEKAGNKLLVKIGLAIGPQVEMYQEKPRQEPIYIENGHIEERKIDFIIPEGYTISNLNDLKIDQTFKDNGELTMGFVSSFEIKGNILSIHIIEEYRKTFYPLNQFDQFRKIINASSDFNKVVLLLEKK